MYYQDPWHLRLSTSPRRVSVPVRRPNQIPAQTPTSRPSEKELSSTLRQPLDALLPDVPDAVPVAEEKQRHLEPESEVALWKERYARLQVEQQESKRRLERRYSVEAEQERKAFLIDMLVVADNLQAALANSSEGDALHLREGIDLTLRGFLDTLSRYNVKPLQAMGRPFDPEWHEAMGYVEHPAIPSGHVAQVLQQGYAIEGTLLRPARVLVAR